MRKVYAASIVWKGILGGGIIVEDDKMTYRTGKLFIPERIKNLEMKFCEIQMIRCGWLLCFPSIEVILPAESYRFILFNRRSLLKTLKRLSSIPFVETSAFPKRKD